MHLLRLNSELYSGLYSGLYSTYSTYVFSVEHKFLAFFLSDYRESGSKTDLPVVPFPEVSKVELGGE